MSGTEVGTDVACNTKEDGNIKTQKSRGYLLTINNPTEEDEKDLVADSYQYLVYQIEKGESGTEHIQAFIYYKNPRVFPKKKYPRAHIERVRSFKAAETYCTKEKTRVRGPYKYGTPPRQGTRTDLENLAKQVLEGTSLEEIARNAPAHYVKYHNGLKALKSDTAPHRTQKPTTVWIWGKTGVGKTRYVIDKHGAENVYIKDGTKWWNGYNGEEAILIDDFDGKWDFRDFLRLLDRYKYQGEYKGGYVKINSPYIYITCEFEPEHVYRKYDADDDKEDNNLQQVLRRLDKIIHIKTPPQTVSKPLREEI